MWGNVAYYIPTTSKSGVDACPPPNCVHGYDHMLELLQDRVTIFGEVFGMSVVLMTSTNLCDWPKNENLLKTRGILSPEYKLSGSPVFAFSFPGRGNLPHDHPRQLRHCNKHLKYRFNKRKKFFKFLLRQRFKPFISQMTSTSLELSSNNAEKSCVSNFEIGNYFFKQRVTMFSAVWWPLDCLQAQHSIVRL